VRRAGEWRLAGPAAVLLALGLAGACGGKLPPVPAPASSHYPEFVFPAAPPVLARHAEAVGRLDRGWQFLQADDVKGAQREFAAALELSAAFYPADAGLGYVGLAQKDYRVALTHFERALRRSPAYAPALVGRGDALLGLSRVAEAEQAFAAALAADPALAIARQRVEVLRLRTLQADLASARRAADAGRYDEARQVYTRAIAASPDSAFLYRELGALERTQGRAPAALAAFRKAVSLDPADARSLVQIGELLEAGGDDAGALQAYTQAAALEPADALTTRIERVKERAALARLPAEFNLIPHSPGITREDLAALIGVRFARVLDEARGREAVLITDARASWAAPWILAVVRAGVMEAYPNHTFQPRVPVRRVDLARVLARLLNLAGASRPALAGQWSQTRPAIADMPVTNLNYPAAVLVVAAGVLPLFEDGTFKPGQPVSGQDATAALDRVQALLGVR
jgi:tetratricopeptide (TPR) repeat protein